MAIRGASPRYLFIGKKLNGDLSYRVGEARELTLKGSLASPTSLLRMVPEYLQSKVFDYQAILE
jgi:hypothetical protein